MIRLGELAALGTAIFWTVSAMSFEYAAKRVGTLSLNLIRLVIAFVMLSIFALASRGLILPTDAPSGAWLWLGLSGLVGFVLGDLLLFRSFIDIGARLAMLIYASAPPLAALLGWAFLGERLSAFGIVGMALTVAGIALVLARPAPARDGVAAAAARPTGAARGVVLAFGGAVGQASGLLLSKVGVAGYNAVGATQIRVIAGMAGFLIIIALLRRFPPLFRSLRDRPAMGAATLGALFGPFIGVTLSLVALQHTSAGVASAIMSTTPVLIIVPSVVLFRERIGVREVAGALVAVGGVALLFLA
jgi:drug/metabolite transporter (DMT)-like permease